MTDYLELLLEEPEAEETNQMPEWRNRKVLPGNVTRRDGERFDVETVRLSGKVRENAKTDQTEREADEHRFVEKETLRIRTVESELLRLHRAVRQAEVQSGRPVERGGNVTEGTDDFWRTGGKTRFRTADYAAMVDAAFARDARRYDGLPGLL